MNKRLEVAKKAESTQEAVEMLAILVDSARSDLQLALAGLEAADVLIKKLESGSLKNETDADA